VANRGRPATKHTAREAEARLAVNLPLRTHRLLKARAAERGVSIRDYIVALLRAEGIQ
jgi:hypothetical protein